jgi:DNA-binding CsgD family transcriptional regulator
MGEESIKFKLKKIKSFSEIIPGIIIIRELKNFEPVFVSENGLKLLHTKLEEIQTETDKFQNSFFHNEDIYDYKKNLNALENNVNEERSQFTFFQQLRLALEDEWIWHICTSEIFHRDNNNLATHIITIANPINHLKHLPNKVNRLVAENIFFKQNFEKYAKLGRREREVLKLVALGKSSLEIAEELFISVDTVNTHRRNIKEKLNINSNYGFSQYAHAFDLL